MSTTLRVFTCVSCGATWDVWGTMFADRHGAIFCPEDLDRTDCPACGGPPEDMNGREPQRLA